LTSRSSSPPSPLSSSAGERIRALLVQKPRFILSEVEECTELNAIRARCLGSAPSPSSPPVEGGEETLGGFVGNRTFGQLQNQTSPPPRWGRAG
jgi:hypothetical protein